MKISCKYCKKDIEVSMFFYDEKISDATFLPREVQEYRAVAMGKTICPCCGKEIIEKFSSVISSSDIVRLAIGKGGTE